MSLTAHRGAMTPRFRSMGIGTPIYEDAKGLAAANGAMAGNAMFELAGAVESFYDAWPAASNVLGGPMYQATDEDGRDQ